MPDPNVTVTAIQIHSVALNRVAGQHIANGFRCKAGALVGVLGILFLGSAKAQLAVLPWVGGVLLVLAMGDACHVALGRRARAACDAFMRKLPLNGGNVPKAEDWLMLPEEERGWKQVGPAMRAMLSLSVWPFYGALLALLAGFYLQESQASAAKPGGPGKVVTNSGPVKVLPRPTLQPPGTLLPGNARYPTQPAPVPRQPPGISQPRILPPQSGVRPAMPLNRPPVVCVKFSK